MRLGVDVGDARIGVAASDASGLVVLPVETVPAHPRGKALRRVVTLAKERSAIEVVVGLPKHLSGAEGASATAARDFASRLATTLDGIRVCLVDERLSTKAGQARLHQAGKNTRESRKHIDQVAAQIILEQAIESERHGAFLPGETVLAHPQSGGTSSEPR